MASQDRLKEIVEEIVARIVSKIHPLKIILFGSAARGVMGFHSDIALSALIPQNIRVCFYCLKGAPHA